MDTLWLFLINLLSVYKILVLIRCVLSWVNIDSNNPLIRFVYEITDPLLEAIHRAFPFIAAGGLDFSPILLLFLLQVIEQFLRGFMQ